MKFVYIYIAGCVGGRGPCPHLRLRRGQEPRAYPPRYTQPFQVYYECTRAYLCALFSCKLSHRTHVTNSEGYLINMNQLLYRSVSDPFYFDTDPDLRIRFR